MLTDNSTDFDLTSKSTFSNGKETFTSRSFAALLAKNEVPPSHKRIADNYLIVKKVFKFQACAAKISNTEKALLNKYGFTTLESMTMHQMFEELSLLQKLSSCEDAQKRSDSDAILEIRVKELKYLEASCYTAVSDEIYNGYQALNLYLREISKFNGVKTLAL